VSEEIKLAFADALRAAEEMAAGGVAADEIVRRHSDAADEILKKVFAKALESVSAAKTAGIALAALGGYGRRELAPGSDLDLLVLHRGWPRESVTTLVRDLTYPLWDAGRELGARVREPRDVLQSLGRADETAALLDARLLAGDEPLLAELRDDVGRRLERGRASFFSQLVAASAERYEKFGRTGHLLEPNIRDGAGGLRDVHTLQWASKLLPGADGIDGLVARGFLSSRDRDLVVAARSFLLAVRVHLHLITQRRRDQLYLQDQDAIAPRMGFTDTEGRTAADALMQQLYAHARHVEDVTSSFWDRTVRRRPRLAWRARPATSVGDGCVVRDGHLEVTAVTSPHEDPAAWLRVFRRGIREGVTVARASLDRLHTGIEGGALRWTPEARDVFVEVLQAGEGGTRALEAMDAAGFLEKLIPQWTGVRCLPQRDTYHRFTVDIHLFTTTATLASSRASEEPDVRDAWSRVSDASALFIAALLHDIGKGKGGDHSEIGTRLASEAAQRMCFGPRQVEDVAFLVSEHLALAEAALRRDLNEPRTIAAVAERAGTTSRLAMLYLLTRADSMSTGPQAWSTFRASLVSELYSKTLAELEGRRPPPPPEGAAPEDALLATELGVGEVRTAQTVTGGAHALVIVARDRPGLFAMVCGVLALRGIDVHDAEIYTRPDGIAVEIFRVTGTHGEVPSERWSRVAADVQGALAGSFDLDEALARKAGQQRHRRGGQKLRAQGRVVVDNDASEGHTVVEVHTEDRLGLLRDLTKTLYEAGCDLSLAKVATYGANVVDVFYVRDFEAARITDESHLRRIEGALRGLFQ
jgi:[protein-PII] uridylyltransferase